jgi:hypothetical protein
VRRGGGVRPGGGLGAGRRQDDGLAVGEGDGAVGLAGDLARLDRDLWAEGAGRGGASLSFFSSVSSSTFSFK